MSENINHPAVAVVGLGYVGLPLALAFGRIMPTTGFDLNARKIAYYQNGRDPMREASADDFAAARHIRFTDDPEQLGAAEFIVVAVPTPIDDTRKPDLTALRAASRSVGENLRSGTTVVFESTVYPGVTEDICGPLLEESSGLKRGRDFHLAYSPERINPGDRAHRLADIVKVVAGEDAQTLEAVAGLYERVVTAGVHRAPSIQVAEAAKVIENTQRDLNIALMNELAIIFDRLGLDTQSVLEAAATKWNFLSFRPGLVGGHCIGVDPYYLTYRAQGLGYHPQVILGGRRINDNMGKYIAESTIKRMIHNGSTIRGACVLVLGLTFKENTPDLRNSRVVDVVRELESFGVEALVWEPLADPVEAEREYGLHPVADLAGVNGAEAIIAAVAHDEVTALNPAQLAEHAAPSAVFVDVKSAFDKPALEAAGFSVWRL